MASTRRLAAILAADVAGYSRLMSADEEDTHERLKAHFRELVDPKIAEHRGGTVKNTGDGMLAEFPSVVDAVRVNSIAAVKCRKRAAIRKPSIARLRNGRLSATDLESEGAFGRVGVDRDDAPADEVGSRRQRLEPDLQLRGTARRDPGIAEVDPLSRFIRHRHVAECGFEVLGEP
jgi:class 3 adenylate cyclase